MDEIFAKDLCKESTNSLFEDKLQFFPVTNLNKYLCNGKSEIKVNINSSSGKFFKKNNAMTIGELITVECASVAYVYISYIT